MAVELKATQDKKRLAVLLLGHGSRKKEANDILREVAGSIERAGRYGVVLPAFLQMEKPDFREAVHILEAKGFKDIAILPYFLYSGAHVQEDLPNEINEAVKKHPDISFRLGACLGFHAKLVDIAVERIEEMFGGHAVQCAMPAQHPIEAESFRIIEKELGQTGLAGGELEVLKRVIHTTADFEFKDILVFGPGALVAGKAAIKRGANIITDVRMAEAGITKERLAHTGSKVMCFSADADVSMTAASAGITKTAASMRKARPLLEGSIVAIGNSPTALREVIRLSAENPPALIIGVPVGFVGAVEAKDDLMSSGLKYIATRGRKGGSTVAAAIANAIVIEAGKDAHT
ncbi:MAG: precorrin-8X methylmutase [Deltaproteobacteria bacterium]